MALTPTVLFDTPQHEIATEVSAALAACSAAHIVTGFATVEGVEALAPGLIANPHKLACCVIGASTYRGFEALDRLVGHGVPLDRLHVHLGHTRLTGLGAKHPFYRYHPMLHSKVYLFDNPDGTAVAFVGSHNMTGFALLGLNGEAAVRLDGSSQEPEIQRIRAHIDAARSQAVPYEPTMKDAYTWWTSEFLEGLGTKVNDFTRDFESRSTVLLLLGASASRIPMDGETIYFELPQALSNLQRLGAEVHIYLFQNAPTSPSEALGSLGTARAALRCNIEGLEREGAAAELRADWFISDLLAPTLTPTPTPFRPSAQPDMQQVRVKVAGRVRGDFEYLFTPAKTRWLPYLDQERAVVAPQSHAALLRSLLLVPPEDKEWYSVRGLHQAEPDTSEAYRAAMRELAPESGHFVLFSRRRRDKSKRVL